MVEKLLNIYRQLDQITISGHANLQHLTSAMDELGGIITEISQTTENVEEE